MLYALGLSLGRAQGAHLINWLGEAATAATIFLLARRSFGARAGLWGALLYYSIPQIALNSWRATVESGWGFFLTLSAYAAFRALDEEREASRWALLAGIFGGAAMGCKYVAWPQIAGLSLLFAAALYRARSSDARPAGRIWAAGALPAFLFTAPWMLRDYLLYRNPIYPFFHEFFASGPMPRWRELTPQGEGGGEGLSTWHGVRQLLSHPWHELAFNNTDWSSIGPIFMLGLPMLALMAPAQRAAKRALAVFLFCWALWMSTSITTSRFLLPALPMYCVLLAACIEGPWSPRLKPLLYGVLACAAVNNLFWDLIWLKTYDADRVIVGAESEASYLSRPIQSHGSISYPAIEYVNERLPESARLLLLGQYRPFSLRRPYVGATGVSWEPLARWTAASSSAEELGRVLDEQKITHVLVNVTDYLLLEDDKDREIVRLSPEKKAILADYWIHRLKKVFESRQPGGWTDVYEITPPLARAEETPDPILALVLNGR